MSKLNIIFAHFGQKELKGWDHAYYDESNKDICMEGTKQDFESPYYEMELCKKSINDKINFISDDYPIH